MQKIGLIYLSSVLLAGFAGCNTDKNPRVTYHTPIPEYSRCSLIVTQDTLRFPLTEDTFGDLESWSIRQSGGRTLIALFDQLSASINEYEYPGLRLVQRLDLNRFFKPNTVKSAYLHNHDSIFVTTRDEIYLIDSTGKTIKNYTFSTKENFLAGRISPENPLLIKGNKIFLSLSPAMKKTSKAALRQWKIMWEADLLKNSTSYKYHLPDLYTKDFYVGKFVKYSYCMNDSSRFVFSFAADTMLYETDLAFYHSAWYAKSKFQSRPIMSTIKEKVNDINLEKKMYMISDSYGAVFYDAFHQRYLRLVKPAISEAQFNQKQMDRPNRMMILDKQFRIIGESEFPPEIILKKTFFTPDGHIYSLIPSRNETEINFIRLEYQENQVTAK